MNIKDYAIQMASLNCPIIPLRPRDKRPLQKGWQDSATTNRETIEKYFNSINGIGINYGIVTGKGLLVIDIDSAEGEKHLLDLQSKHGQLPETFRVKTGKGRHLYFRFSETIELKNSAGKLGKNIDVRADGGFVVGPGSIHPTGKVYEAENFEVGINILPDSWIEVFTKPESTLNAIDLTSQSAKNILAQACQEITIAKKGVRNHTLNKQAFLLGAYINTGEYSRETIEQHLTLAALHAGLEEKEIQNTIRSGIDAGIKPCAVDPPKSIALIQPKIFTAKELMNMEFEETRWAVPNLIPEGLTLLVGSPKIGKSWLSLDLCVAVTSGKNALNFFEAQQGSVLGLMLEDGEKRLKKRLQILSNEEHLNYYGDNCKFATQWPKLNEGGIDALQNWINEEISPTLIVIDTLQHFRPKMKSNSNNYEQDYEAVGLLQRFAINNQIGVIAIHHTRKMSASDVFDEISGTQGIAGAADALLVLKRSRNQSDAVLHCTGRDVEERELALQFNSETFQWSVLGDAHSYIGGKLRLKIAETLKNSKEALSPKEIADIIGEKPDNIRKTISRMADDGQLVRESRGRYKFFQGEIFDYPSLLSQEVYLSQVSSCPISNNETLPATMGVTANPLMERAPGDDCDIGTHNAQDII